MTKYIKKNYNSLFSEYTKEQICVTYNIYPNISESNLKYILKEYFFSGIKLDLKIIPYVNDLQENFSIAQYERYKKFRKNKKSVSNSLDFFIAKYGVIGSYDRWLESNNKNKKSKTKEGFIKKYGDKEGSFRWDSFCEKNKGNFSLERMIDIYGKEVGRKKYNDLIQKLKNKNKLSYYIKKYGLEKGTIKYNARNLKNSKSSKLNSLWVRNTPAYNKYRKLMEDKGCWSKLSDQDDIQMYRRLVLYITGLQDLKSLKDFEKRGHQRDKGSYALDHKISIKYGFQHNILPYIIGGIDNLQMLTHSENSSKKDKCYSSLIQRNKNV